MANVGGPDALRAVPQLAAVIPDVANALYAARWSRGGNTAFTANILTGTTDTAANPH